MAARLRVASISEEDLRIDCLPRKTGQAFRAFTRARWLASSNWYLAGGTALALHAGHRQSEDLDFFMNQVTYDVRSLERTLLGTGQWLTSLRAEGTLYGSFMGAKASFIAYPFYKPLKMFRCGILRMLSPEDIAAMKIEAISQRGKKRDFVDLYWYSINRESLDTVILRSMSQYVKQEHNMPHILKSLTYFADAEKDPMPRLFFNADWKAIRSYFLTEAPKVARKLLF
ncbi:hypothetical protein A3J43_03845 [Candidatus Uhrbacteria bacterium RIFCSPHIGHO2_12_FULL_54_23]|uniref:Nucleotidyl transferase AbiEii/AbiGii toxin family protein n=3 Tax=Candidatus Uhriibacteriota TaxID=1752732 RepID=A0A1F7UL27_9BACT|nr:MAG: hypothetical protein A3J43_03845 [Candidatus Uhrbacteria bacterium RIFCSPHIGHO2_12_FULL_54_23]OGL84710.1 MAG: hypothetical protein A3B36_01475 [Candidatus Uhrbacteria bacterium RIFCSPLOWO2_01_FULL_55_36]OGL90966.1 MAG: hypothetical protein A3J36_02585 [Candidatus Uhrbacteria bacterium RIFCSPLOWO2_02_FULL_54_37]